VFVTSYTALERIPGSLIEASEDSGANGWQTFRNVIWPLSRQGTALGFSLAFLVAVGDYVTPSMVGGLDGTMLGMVIASQFGLAANWPLGAAMAVTRWRDRRGRGSSSPTRARSILDPRQRRGDGSTAGIGAPGPCANISTPGFLSSLPISCCSRRSPSSRSSPLRSTIQTLPLRSSLSGMPPARRQAGFAALRRTWIIAISAVTISCRRRASR
jgi:hypothetical protein